MKEQDKLQTEQKTILATTSTCFDCVGMITNGFALFLLSLEVEIYDVKKGEKVDEASRPLAKDS